MAKTIRVEEWGNRRVKIIECVECGDEIACPNFTNTCECGADYNSAGQHLAPRSQWGEETGESLSDILMADTDPWGD